jgi:acyl-CoA reductase-like NAD-dependent aldehyde dehydrogenase
MNPIFVYKPSSMKNAAKTVLRSAFSFSGQRLDSCSKVVVLAEDQKSFVDALVAEAKNMIVSDPAELGTFTGPIISEEKLDDFVETVGLVKDSIVFGGKRIKGELTENGFYVMPAIVMGLDEDHDLNNIDSTLPILTIQTAEDVDQAIDLINCSEYGLSVGIITKDEKIAEKFVNETDAEEAFINDPSRNIGSASKAFVGYFTQ